MALDMDQLKAIFQEECRDNLQLIEQELVSFNVDDPDSEVINTIFRAAHSIKGGAGTFEFNEISEFTHLIETLLDEARNDQRQLKTSDIDVLLKSNDFIEAMLTSYENKEAIDQTTKASLMAELDKILRSGSTQTSTNVEAQSNNTEALPSDSNETNIDEGDILGWKVTFKPFEDILFSGNDPARIIKELLTLTNEHQVTCHTDKLPTFDDLEPEQCLLWWECVLRGAIEKSDIVEVFDWVDDECDLLIEPLFTQSSLSQHSVTNTLSPNTLTEENKPSITSDTNNHQEVSQQEVKETTESVPSPSSAVEAVESNSAQSTTTTKSKSNYSIRVDIEKIDLLINLVGELVITQSMINELSHNFDMSKLESLQTGIEQLLQNTREIQDSVLNIRMLPVSFAFNRFPRLVRDIAPKLGKEIELHISGEHTEIDKTVLEKITDPLVHLIRNAIDHGVELPESRQQNGKEAQGNVYLSAFHQGGNVVIEIEDDGAGINAERVFNKAKEKGLISEHTRQSDMSDEQIFMLLFAPGLSTAEQVSDLSGRGVGMDVVKKNIEALSGSISVQSEQGKGSKFTITLPLTLSILDGQLVSVCEHVYVIPLISIIESIQIEPTKVNEAAGGQKLYQLRDENLPIICLNEMFGMDPVKDFNNGILCFVETGGQKVGLHLDELLGQQQVVIKSLESNFRKVPGFSGATILGNGSVSMIIDIQNLVSQFINNKQSPSLAGAR
ncbi:chemotaxis protein CheA [Vibrio sp.]|nr:chemotaxis protein CheA [Vibrio sp.]